MTLSRAWWTPYLYAVLFGCFATLVEVTSKASLVNTLVPEKQQAGSIVQESTAILKFDKLS